MRALQHDCSRQLRYNQFGGNFSGWVPVPKLSTRQNKRLFFFYNREMTRRNQPGNGYADVPDATILSGNFQPWLLTTNMTYAPQFKNGTVFEPGTITRDGAGNITGGTPFPNNTVPQSMWQPLSANMLKIYTGIPGYASLPATPGQPGYVRYFFNNPDNLIKNQDLLRVDYAINAKMNSFFRWVNDYQKETIQNGIWTGEPFPMQPQARPKPGSSWAWNLVTTFTPTVASETILSYNHQSQSLSVVGTNPLDRNALGANFTQIFPDTNITNSVPDVNTGAGVNFSLGDPGWHNWGKDYGATENLSWVKGNHSFKFGVFYNRDDKAQTGTWGMEGSINYGSGSSMPLDTGNGLANLMLGNFNSYTNLSGAVFPWFRFWEFDAYAQDSWKVTKRLTIDYGLRFSHMMPTYTVVRGGTVGGEGNWTLYSVNLAAYNASEKPTINLSNGFIVGNPLTALAPLGLNCDPCSGTDPGFSPAKTFPEPRVGLAYDLFGDGTTALRGGFGMFNERLRQNNFNFGAGGQWPNLYSGTVYNGNVSGFSTAGVGSASSPIQPPSMTIWPTNNTMPTIYSWYIGIQRQLPAKFALDLSYAGNHSVHLMDQRQVNALPAGYLHEQQPVAVGELLEQRAAAVLRLGKPDRHRDPRLLALRRHDAAHQPALRQQLLGELQLHLVAHHGHERQRFRHHQQPVLHQVQLCQRRVRPAEPGLARFHLPVAEGEGRAGHSRAAGIFRRMGAHGHCPLAIGYAGDHHFQRKPVRREHRQPVSQPGRQSLLRRRCNLVLAQPGGFRSSAGWPVG